MGYSVTWVDLESEDEGINGAGIARFALSLLGEHELLQAVGLGAPRYWRVQRHGAALCSQDKFLNMNENIYTHVDVQGCWV